MRRQAEVGGLEWQGVTSYGLDGWAALGKAPLDLLLSISMLEGQPEASAVVEATKDAATIWSAYYGPSGRPSATGAAPAG